MAISKAEKTVFNAEIKSVKEEIDQHNSKIKEVTVKKKKMSNIAAYYSLELAVVHLDIIDRYMKINDLSLEILRIKSEKFLNEARKEFYIVLQEIEEVVGHSVDRSLRENDEFLIKIDKLNPKKILTIIDRLHSVYYNIKNKMGEGSKWQWSFVELMARVAIITKNITPFSDVAKLRDPRTEFFFERKDLMQLCKDSLTEAAKQYRTKYEMAGKAREDLKRSIELLAALRKIHVLFGEDAEATKLKNTIDAAKQALEAEDREKDKKSEEKK